MDWFVKKDSVVRRIWGKSDTILFIFAGAAAEFSINKAVDWLFFTGRLPADPLGRLFSTVTYARDIVFSTNEKSNAVIDQMRAIHQSVEASRKSTIPDWAYRDVLYMLIDYSIRSFELLERKMADDEAEEVFQVFRRVGDRMGLADLPVTYHSWVHDRSLHMHRDLHASAHTIKLYGQYRKHLGAIRYRILRAAQAVIVPQYVRDQLNLRFAASFVPVIAVYRLAVRLKLDWPLKRLILPNQYINQIRALDRFA